MLLLRTALLVTEQADPAKPKVPIYNLLERSDFEGKLLEADNWLTNEYPTQVDKIANLFGEGRVSDMAN